MPASDHYNNMSLRVRCIGNMAHIIVYNLKGCQDPTFSSTRDSGTCWKADDEFDAYVDCSNPSADASNGAMSAATSVFAAVAGAMMAMVL